MIPIKPAQGYRISMWGRIDRERPLSLDERRPHMWLDVQFFGADQKTQIGEPQSAVHLIPGSVLAGGRNELLYVSGKWTETGKPSPPARGAPLFPELRWPPWLSRDAPHPAIVRSDSMIATRR